MAVLYSLPYCPANGPDNEMNVSIVWLFKLTTAPRHIKPPRENINKTYLRLKNFFMKMLGTCEISNNSSPIIYVLCLL